MPHHLVGARPAGRLYRHLVRWRAIENGKHAAVAGRAPAALQSARRVVAEAAVAEQGPRHLQFAFQDEELLIRGAAPGAFPGPARRDVQQRRDPTVRRVFIQHPDLDAGWNTRRRPWHGCHREGIEIFRLRSGQ